MNRTRIILYSPSHIKIYDKNLKPTLKRFFRVISFYFHKTYSNTIIVLFISYIESLLFASI